MGRIFPVSQSLDNELSGAAVDLKIERGGGDGGNGGDLPHGYPLKACYRRRLAI